MSDVRTRVDEALRTVRLDTPDVSAAWQRGRRRRKVRVVAVTAAALAVVGVGTSVVTGSGLPDALPPAGSTETVDAYPQRIDDPWFTRDLDDAPSVLAGTLRTGNYDLFGVAEDGGLYEIPQSDDTWGGHEPVLSDDGTKLAWLATPTTYVARDLTTGEVVEYDGLGDNREGTSEPYMTYDQAPGFWSPDNEHLLIAGDASDSTGAASTSLLLDDRGGFVAIPRPRGSWPVGWYDATHPAWLTKRVRPTLVVTNLGGEVTRRVVLDTVAPDITFFGQWSGALSPDSSTLLITAEDARLFFDATTGKQIGDVAPGEVSSCLPSWREGEAVNLVRSDAGSALVELTNDTPVTVVEPTVSVGCLHLSPAALAGGPSWHPLGTSNAWPTWHVGELVLGGIGVPSVLAGLLWWRRRRRVAG